jgi:hypothetical protein
VWGPAPPILPPHFHPAKEFGAIQHADNTSRLGSDENWTIAAPYPAFVAVRSSALRPMERIEARSILENIPFGGAGCYNA